MSVGTTKRMAYLARKSCGCCVAVTVDTPEHAATVALFVAACIRNGETVERLPVASVQQDDLLARCWHCDTCRAEVPEIWRYRHRNYCLPCFFDDQRGGRIPPNARPRTRTRTEVAS